MEKTKSIFFNNKQLLPPSFTKFVGSIFFFSLKKDLHLLSHGLSLFFLIILMVPTCKGIKEVGPMIRCNARTP